MLLWLWCGPAATAPVRPLAWEPPYAAGVAQEIAKRPKKKERKKERKTSYVHMSMWERLEREGGKEGVGGREVEGIHIRTEVRIFFFLL